MALAGAEDEPGGALSEVAAARKALGRGRPGPRARGAGQRLAEASYVLDDVAADLARYLDELDAEPGRLEWIAGRVRPWPGSPASTAPPSPRCWTGRPRPPVRLGELESSDERIAELSGEVAALAAELTALAATITEARHRRPPPWPRRCAVELGDLAMPHARIRFEVSTAELGPHGADQVERLQRQPRANAAAWPRWRPGRAVPRTAGPGGRAGRGP